MSQDKRLLRLNEQFKREISEILRRDVQDPRVGSPMITAARVTPDLWLARVFVRLHGDEKEQAQTLAGLTAAAPYVRKRLGKMLRLRRVPEIRFIADDTLTGAARVEEILREVGPIPDPEISESESIDEQTPVGQDEPAESDGPTGGHEPG